MIIARPSPAFRSSSTNAQIEKVVDSAPRWSLEWIYFSLVISAFCFTPFIRRLIDYRNGAFNPVQITSLIPFLMLLPLALVCFRAERMARLTRPLRILAWIWLATFTYGFLIAFAIGNVDAAGVALVQYLVPMLAGIWLAGQGLSVKQTLRRLAVIILPCAALIATYGLFQWVQPPPWDVLWVQGSDFYIVGDPVPFAMRVFSTLNSPGTAGDFFALTIVLLLPWLRLRSVWVWPLLTALGAALLLTLTREAWVGLVVGVVVYLVASPRRLATAPLLAVYAAFMVALAVSLPAFLGSGQNSDVITSRISTFGDVGHDVSALDRENEIQNALQKGLSNPVGTGLGVLGSASKLDENAQAAIGTVLDSGYLARLIELGWLGTVGYVVVVIGGPLVLTYQLFRKKSGASTEARVAGAVAVGLCAVLAWGDAADDAHLGIDGFFFWLALALGSLAIQSIAAPEPPPVRSGLQGLVR
jgi:putative inorganic carbon (HCO3(-)) transporter